MFDEIKNINSSKTELKKFGFTIGIVLLIVAAVMFFYSNEIFYYFAGGGVLLILLGWIAPVMLLPLQKGWMTLAVVLGFFMTRIILSILYYLIITPIGLTAKLFGKDFLDRKIEKEKKSYWHYRERKPYEKIETERQF